MYGTMKQRKAQRKQSADERQAAYNTLTLEEKIKRARERGHTGSREYQRLTKMQAAR
jgi:hypothetical protein